MRPDGFRDITGESARSSSESDAIAFPQIGRTPQIDRRFALR